MKPVCHDRYSSWVLGIIFWPKMLVLTHFLTFQRCSSPNTKALQERNKIEDATPVEGGDIGLMLLGISGKVLERSLQ